MFTHCSHKKLTVLPVDFANEEFLRSCLKLDILMLWYRLNDTVLALSISRLEKFI